MTHSNFNLRDKILKAIMSKLFPKLENICHIFDLEEISVHEKIPHKSGSFMHGNHNIKNHFVFNVKANKLTKIKECSITTKTSEYGSPKITSIYEFEEKNDLSFDSLICMSKLFLEKIETYLEKESETNKVIDEINKLEIIYKKEFLLEKIKREVPKQKKQRAPRAPRVAQHNRDVDDVVEQIDFDYDRYIGDVLNEPTIGKEYMKSLINQITKYDYNDYVNISKKIF